MLVRVGSSKDVATGQMRVFDVAGTKVNVASADGHLYAFDDTCPHRGCSVAKDTLHGTTVPRGLYVLDRCAWKGRIYLPRREDSPSLMIARYRRLREE
jgi:nitrite reductase/ring-hydroxylating ferredoxin subunit